MKNTFVFIAFFCCAVFKLYAQQHNFAVVEYTEINNTEAPNKLSCTLSVNENVSIFQERYSGKVELDTTPLPEGTFRTHSVFKFDPYMKTDRAAKQLLFFDIMASKTCLIEDVFPEIKWNVTQETKTIAGYDCIKATATYRGREWYAWFAPGIPLPFGPWKLHGLPGLILQANDASKRFEFIATKISFTKSDVFSKDFKTLMDADNKKPIAYRKFLENNEEIMENNMAKLQSQLGNATITHKKAPRSGYELKYEWE